MIPSDTKLFLTQGVNFYSYLSPNIWEGYRDLQVYEEEKKKADSIFMKAEEIMRVLGVSQSEAYRIIKRLNEELKAQGYMVVSGRVSRRYFEEKIYGYKDCAVKD